MHLITSFFILFMLLPSLSVAEEFRDIPEELFCVELGGIYDLGDPEGKHPGNIPVKKIAGIKRFLGNGIHYFFHPKEEGNCKEESNCLGYLEKCENPEGQNFGTSYRLYLLPVLPPSITNTAQLEQTKLKWEVQSIGWSQNANTKEEAYNWAVDLCEKLKADFSAPPKITDHSGSKWFQCSFSSGDREYKVNNINVIRSIELSYKIGIIAGKDEAVEEIFQKLHAEDIKPK